MLAKSTEATLAAHIMLIKGHLFASAAVAYQLLYETAVLIAAKT